MEKLEFTIDIQAPVDKVYRTMLGLDDKTTYEQWTAEFNPTSTFEGSWDKDSTIYFIGTDEKGEKGGMISEIVAHQPAEFVSIRHYGLLSGDKEITEGPEVEQWAGGLENYSFEEHKGTTTVTVETDTVESYKAYFETTWPKALHKLRTLVE